MPQRWNSIDWHNENFKGEDKLCKKFGLTKTPQSGAGWKCKSDAYTKTVRVEIKETDKDSISVKYSWLIKIIKEALITGKVPVLLFRIKELKFVIVPADFFFGLREVHNGDSTEEYCTEETTK